MPFKSLRELLLKPFGCRFFVYMLCFDQTVDLGGNINYFVTEQLLKTV
jgi:hypothetical protein